MKINIVSKKEMNQERIFLDQWLQLCGYLPECFPVEEEGPFNIDSTLEIQYLQSSLCIKVLKSFLANSSKNDLKGVLTSVMHFINRIEEGERQLYPGCLDDRDLCLDSFINLYIEKQLYSTLFLLESGYINGTMGYSLIRKVKCFMEELSNISSENQFVKFTKIVLESKLAKMEKKLKMVHWNKVEGLIDGASQVQENLSFRHYQDSIQFSKSKFYGMIPGEYDKEWASLRGIVMNSSLVFYKLGFLQEYYWNDKKEAVQFYQNSLFINPYQVAPLYKMATIYESSGKKDTSFSLYLKVLNLIYDVDRKSEKKEFDFSYLEPIDIDYALRSLDHLDQYPNMNSFVLESRKRLEHSLDSNIFLSTFVLDEYRDEQKTMILKQIRK